MPRKPAPLPPLSRGQPYSSSRYFPSSELSKSQSSSRHRRRRPCPLLTSRISAGRSKTPLPHCWHKCFALMPTILWPAQPPADWPLTARKLDINRTTIYVGFPFSTALRTTGSVRKPASRVRSLPSSGQRPLLQEHNGCLGLILTFGYHLPEAKPKLVANST